MADNERDAILDKLLQLPENKVSSSLICSNALTAKARIQSGHHQVLAYSYAMNAHLLTEIMACRFHSFDL